MDPATNAGLLVADSDAWFRVDRAKAVASSNQAAVLLLSEEKVPSVPRPHQHNPCPNRARHFYLSEGTTINLIGDKTPTSPSVILFLLPPSLPLSRARILVLLHLPFWIASHGSIDPLSPANITGNQPQTSDQHRPDAIHHKQLL